MSKQHKPNRDLTESSWGRAEEAIARYEKAIESQPADVAALFGLGNAQASLGRFEAASSTFDQVISLRPELAAAHFNKANADREMGELERAVSAYEAAIRLDPRAIFYNNLGTTLSGLDRAEEAIDAFRQAIDRDPSLESTHMNLCTALSVAGDWKATVQACHTALETHPSSTRILKILAATWERTAVLSNAITCLEHVLQIDPDDVSVHLTLGRACLGIGDLAKAEVHLRAALSQDGDKATAYADLGEVFRRRGAIEEATNQQELALNCDPTHAAAHSNLLLTMVHDQRVSAGRLRQKSFSWAERHASRIAALPAKPSSNQDRRRIGYVAGCLYEHPLGLLLEPVLRWHDRSRFEIHCYAFQVGEDEQTTILRELADSWTDITSMSDESAAHAIREDEVDILVDLTGHCRPNRLLVFAYKPAPIQATWIGHSSTTGLPTMDYLLADPCVVPVEDEPYFVETIERLPERHLCFKAPEVNIEPRTGPPGQPFTFGCFTDSAQIGTQVIELWARILADVPGSKLLLKANDLDDRSVQIRLLSQFAERTIDSQRIELEGLSSREERLTAQRRVDLVLDPFPVNGAMTTLEALWMEVPVLTLRGNRYSGRIGEAILSAVGLPELVMISPTDYRREAAKLASDHELLMRLRQGLRERLLTSALCDLATFTRDLEDAYQRMWGRHQAQTT